MNEQRLKSLHSALPAMNIDDISYENFRAGMSNPENRAKFFESILPYIEQNMTLEQFESELVGSEETPLGREPIEPMYQYHKNQLDHYGLSDKIDEDKVTLDDLPISDAEKERLGSATKYKDLSKDTAGQLQMLRGDQIKAMREREKNRGFFKKFMGSLVLGTGDLQDMAGGALDYFGFDETAKSIRDKAREVQEFYTTEEHMKEFEWSDVADLDFWSSKAPRMIPTIASIIPAAVAGGVGGAALAGKIGLGVVGTKVSAAVGAAISARPIESLMEGAGTFNKLKDEGYAEEVAAEAARDVFYDNMKLVAADAGQFSLALLKIPAPMRKSMGKYITNAVKVGKIGVAGGSEGYEEVLQGYISELAEKNAKGELPPELRKYLYLSSPEIKEMFALGTLAGIGMDVVGGAFKGRLDKNEVDNIVNEKLKVTKEEQKSWEEELAKPPTEPAVKEKEKPVEKETAVEETVITEKDITKKDVIKEGDITKGEVKVEEDENIVSEEEVDIDPEEGVKEVTNFFQALDPKTKISWSDELRTLQNEIEDPKSDVTAESALASIEAAGYDPKKVKPSDVWVKGSTVQEVKDGVVIDQIKLYKGADIGTVIEERSESWYKRQSQTDSGFESNIQKERKNYEESTGEKTTESDLEWFSTLAKQNAVGGTISGKLSRTLKNLLNKFKEYAEALVKQSEKFKTLVKEGKVSPELKTYLDQSVLAKTPTVDMAGNQTFEMVLTDRAKLVQKVPELKPIQKFLTDKEISELSNVTKPTLQKIVDQYNKLKQQGVEKDMPAAAIAGISKRGWYKNSAQAIVDAFGSVDGFRFASLLAATSPQTSVESNLKNTLNIWKNWDAAGRPTDKNAILDIMGESVEGEKGKDSILEAWVNNSLRSLQTKDVNDIRLSGAKVDSFLRNLTGNPTEVTNDTWMANFGNVSQDEYFAARKTAQVVDKTPDTKGEVGVKSAGYLAFNAIVRKTANKLTKLNPSNPWTPAEVQETVWSWSKAALERRRIGGRSIEQLVKEGEITDAMIAETPDFAKLLKIPEFNNILKGTKYEKRIEKLKEKGQIARDAKLDEKQSRNLSRAARRLDKIFRKRSIKELSVQSTKNISYERVNNFDRGGIYRRATGLYRNNNLGKVRTYSLDKKFKEKLNNIGCSHLPFYELIGDGREKTFYNALNTVKKEMGDFGASVDIYATPEEYSGLKLFLSNDKNSGFAIKEDGDIVAVFNSNKNRQTKKSHLLTAQLALAVQAGGRKLDAFNIYLTDIYTKLGFRPVSRVKWNDKFAPEGWNKELFKGYNNGKPDVYTYIFDPTFNRKIPAVKDIKPFNNYDQAIQYQQDKLNELIQNPNRKTFELELITPQELKEIRIQERKDRQAKIQQIRELDAKEESKMIPEFNRKRRAYIDLDGFERGQVSDRIRKLTTKEEREIMPFLMEKTLIPDEMGRPDLQNLINDPTVRKKLKPHVDEMRKMFDKYWQRQVSWNKDLTDFEKENYITHIWDVPRNKKTDVMNWFATHNKFQKKRYISTLSEGIKEWGLKPKFNDILDVFNTYANLTTNVLANKQYVKDIRGLEKNGISLISMSKDIPPEWKPIINPAMYNSHTGQYFKVHPDLENKLGVVFDSRISFDNSRALKAYEGINAVFKKAQLSLSLFHHLALTESALVIGGIKSTIKMWAGIPVESMWKGKKGAWVNAEMAKDGIKNGLQLGASADIPVQSINGMLATARAKTNNVPFLGKLTKLLETANEKWDAVLWDWMHDGFKVLAYENLVSKADPNKVDMKTYKREAAQLVNDTFGGQNFDVLMVNPKTIQIASWTLLSPDWTVSTIRQALAPTSFGSVMKTPEGRKIRAKAGAAFWAKAGLYSFVFVNLLNYLNRKRDMEENPQYYPEFKEVDPTFWDYTMFGNTAGNKTYLFGGRYNDNREEYVRWGKQFRELFEYFYDDTGINIPKAAINRIGAKGSPNVQLAFQMFSGETPSGFKNYDLKDKDGIDWIMGATKTLSRQLLPFSVQGIFRDDKEFRWYNMAFPSKAGTSEPQLENLLYRRLKSAIRWGDGVLTDNVVREIGIDALRNGILPHKLGKNVTSRLASEFGREIREGLKTPEDYIKKANELPAGKLKAQLLTEAAMIKNKNALLKAAYSGLKQLEIDFKKHKILNKELYEN